MHSASAIATGGVNTPQTLETVAAGRGRPPPQLPKSPVAAAGWVDPPPRMYPEVCLWPSCFQTIIGEPARCEAGLVDRLQRPEY